MKKKYFSSLKYHIFQGYSCRLHNCSSCWSCTRQLWNAAAVAWGGSTHIVRGRPPVANIFRQRTNSFCLFFKPSKIFQNITKHSMRPGPLKANNCRQRAKKFPHFQTLSKFTWPTKWEGGHQSQIFAEEEQIVFFLIFQAFQNISKLWEGGRQLQILADKEQLWRKVLLDAAV